MFRVYVLTVCFLSFFVPCALGQDAYTQIKEQYNQSRADNIESTEPARIQQCRKYVSGLFDVITNDDLSNGRLWTGIFNFSSCDGRTFRANLNSMIRAGYSLVDFGLVDIPRSSQVYVLLEKAEEIQSK
ncbi:MAG: hypothetical protein KKB70_08505 [Proteobacteria bacterium]|nr:hypothetical protein [Pseudomonadota bacterium]